MPKPLFTECLTILEEDFLVSRLPWPHGAALCPSPLVHAHGAALHLPGPGHEDLDQVHRLAGDVVLRTQAFPSGALLLTETESPPPAHTLVKGCISCVGALQLLSRQSQNGLSRFCSLFVCSLLTVRIYNITMLVILYINIRVG